MFKLFLTCNVSKVRNPKCDKISLAASNSEEGDGSLHSCLLLNIRDLCIFSLSNLTLLCTLSMMLSIVSFSAFSSTDDAIKHCKVGIIVSLDQLKKIDSD